jgi:hypothetical protein
VPPAGFAMAGPAAKAVVIAVARKAAAASRAKVFLDTSCLDSVVPGRERRSGVDGDRGGGAAIPAGPPTGPLGYPCVNDLSFSSDTTSVWPAAVSTASDWTGPTPLAIHVLTTIVSV